jgi:hypothetical protein
MTLVTLARQEWKAIAEELNVAGRDDTPPGLRERIATLLAATPAAWPDQACILELADLAAVEFVESIVRQRKKRIALPEFQWQEQSSIAEAEQIIRDHQHRPPDL